MAKVLLTSKSNAMKSYLPLLTFAILLTSCTSVYKSGQTPDDVYYSPDRPQDEYVRVEKQDNRMYRNNDVALEDRYLRMKVRNRRYAFLDNDYDYYYGSNYNQYNDYYRINTSMYGNYNWGLWNNGYNSFYYTPSYYNSHYYNPYYYNPYYGNPYYAGTVYGNVKPVYNKPRTGNLQVFGVNGNDNNQQRANSKVYSTSSGSDENYRSSGSNAGGFLRNTFGSGNNSSSESRNSSSSSGSNNSSSSSSSGSGSSHAPVRKF